MIYCKDMDQARLKEWCEREYSSPGANENDKAEHLEALIRGLEDGTIRSAEPMEDGEWQVNQWVKMGILIYFRFRKIEVIGSGPIQYLDKIPVRIFEPSSGVRTVPQSLVRRGAHVAKGVIVMPGFVNIGAYVGSGTMVDTWATVGSCAQIGKDVHLSGGVGIGGVLEPLQAAPVIIEDGAFIGSRCIVVEGARVGKEAVLGAGVTITGSTSIIDVSGLEPRTYKGIVPPRSVVIPGSLEKQFPAGKYLMPCALIIGQRKASTDLKTSLNQTLRDFDISA